MNDTLLLLLFGGCLGTIAANIMVMLLVFWRLSKQLPRIRRVIHIPCKIEDFDKVVETWTAGPWKYCRCAEQAPGIVQIWFQEQ